MTRSRLLAGALAAALAALACSDMVSPSRPSRYDWRLIVDLDSTGTVTDTLSFHWPRNRLPVRVWVEDTLDLPAHIRHGIAEWKGALLYNEWDATLVQDSTRADVIVRATQPPPQTLPSPPIRLEGGFLSCQGATDIDTVGTRFQLAVPLRVYIVAALPNAADLQTCLGVVAAHELGHSLGLFQHSADSLDLMFGAPTAPALTDRDIGTITNAYHYPVDMVPVGP